MRALLVASNTTSRTNAAKRPRETIKHDPSHAVEDTQDHTQDGMPYTDEPLADESWVEEYERRQGEHDREMNELSLRLNGQNHVDSW